MVAWIDAPEHRFAGTSGVADITDDTPMPPESTSWIGSITKMFTAAVIVQLTEESVLTLDDPLALWLPEVAEQLPHGDQITLRHLLAHTFGLFNALIRGNNHGNNYWRTAEAEIDPCRVRSPQEWGAVRGGGEPPEHAPPLAGGTLLC